MLFAINKDIFTPHLMVFYPCIVLSFKGRDDPNSTFLHMFGHNTKVFNINASKKVCFFRKACFLSGRPATLQKNISKYTKLLITANQFMNTV